MSGVLLGCFLSADKQNKKRGGGNGGPRLQNYCLCWHNFYFNLIFVFRFWALKNSRSYAPPEFFLVVLQHPQHPRLPRAYLHGFYGADLCERCDHRISKEEKCIAHVLEWMLLLI